MKSLNSALFSKYELRSEESNSIFAGGPDSEYCGCVDYHSSTNVDTREKDYISSC